MTPHHIPKATLYHFTGSVWSAVPVLTALEKGFTEEQLEQRLVNLFEGANFSPAFLKSEFPHRIYPRRTRILTPSLPSPVSPKGTSSP